MKFTTNRIELEKAVKAVAAVAAPEKSNNPCLAGILIEVKAKKLVLSATDGARYIQRFMTLDPASVESAGLALVPAKRLAQILGDATADDVTLDANDRRLAIKSGGGRLQLTKIDDAEFPAMPKVDKKKADAAVVNGASLSIGLAKCFCYTQGANKNYSLGGVYLVAGHNEITLAASDCHRLSVYKTEGKGEAGAACIIPRDSLADISALAAMDGGDLELSIASSHLRVESKNGAFCSSLIEGAFPRYEEIIPENLPTQYTAEKAQLAAALTAASRVADESTGAVWLKSVDGGLEVSVNKSATGTANVTATATKDQGDDLAVLLNHKYLADALKHVALETVTIQANTAADPILIFENDWRHVIMPINPTTIGEGAE